MATYSRRLNRSLELQVTGNCGYVGGANLTLDAVTAAEDVSHVVIGQLSVRLVHPHWTVTAYVKAPLSGGSDTFGFGNPFTFRLLDQTTPARPTTAGLSVSLNLP